MFGAKIQQTILGLALALPISTVRQQQWQPALMRERGRGMCSYLEFSRVICKPKLLVLVPLR
jgi:hypothetical protein